MSVSPAAIRRPLAVDTLALHVGQEMPDRATGARATPNLVHLSIGLEDADDLRAYLDRALFAAVAADASHTTNTAPLRSEHAA